MNLHCRKNSEISWQIMTFEQKSKNTSTEQKAIINSLPELGIEPETNEVKLCNCFNVIGQNVHT